MDTTKEGGKIDSLDIFDLIVKPNFCINGCFGIYPDY